MSPPVSQSPAASNGFQNLLLLAIIGLAACAHRVPSLEQEVEQLKHNQVRILRELAELRQSLEAGSAPGKPAQARPRKIDLEGISFRGSPEAPVTIVEFTDYQCPYCRRHAQNTLPQLLERYIETGKLRYGVREFPLEQLHPDAIRLAHAALCAGEQGRYWEMHDRLMATPQQATRKSIAPAAKALEIDEPAFAACIDTQRQADTIRSDVASGVQLGVRGTPFFAIGRTGTDGARQLSIASTLTGAQPFERFAALIDPLVAPAADAGE